MNTKNSEIYILSILIYFKRKLLSVSLALMALYTCSYWHILGIPNIFSGSWGKSICTEESVAAIISRSFVASLKLALLSTVPVLPIRSTLYSIQSLYTA